MTDYKRYDDFPLYDPGCMFGDCESNNKSILLIIACLAWLVHLSRLILNHIKYLYNKFRVSRTSIESSV